MYYIFWQMHKIFENFPKRYKVRIFKNRQFISSHKVLEISAQSSILRSPKQKESKSLILFVTFTHPPHLNIFLFFVKLVSTKTATIYIHSIVVPISTQT